MITVKKQKDGKWAVMDGALVYDTYDSENDAREAAAKYKKESDMNDDVQDRIDALVEEMCAKYQIDHEDVRQAIKDSL
jgi:hypothetical protein